MAAVYQVVSIWHHPKNKSPFSWHLIFGSSFLWRLNEPQPWWPFVYFGKSGNTTRHVKQNMWQIQWDGYVVSYDGF